MGSRYLIKQLTMDCYPSVKSIYITVRDSRNMFIFFSELFKLVNNHDRRFYENFIGKNVNTIMIDQETMTVQEHWQYQHRWNQFMKKYEKSYYKPFPNVHWLTINHWLPSIHFLTKIIGTRYLSLLLLLLSISLLSVSLL